MGKKTAFVLAGGGAAGSYQAGALKAAEELGIKPDFLWGTSAGALNAAGYSYAGIQQLISIWKSVKSRGDIFGTNLFRLLGLPFGVDGIYHSTPLRKKVEKIILGRKPQYLTFVNVTDLQSGRLVQASSAMEDQSKFIDWVVASASIPILVEPVKDRYVDGGVLENIPLKSVIEQGAERIFMFLNFPHERSKRIGKMKDVSGLVEIAKRSVELIMAEGYHEDFQHHKVYDRKVEIHLVAPQDHVIDVMDFDNSKIKSAIEIGYQDASQILTKAVKVRQEH